MVLIGPPLAMGDFTVLTNLLADEGLVQHIGAFTG